MNIATRQLSHTFVFIMGLLLIIGGIVTSKEGAWVGGLIIAAVNFQQLQKLNRTNSPR